MTELLIRTIARRPVGRLARPSAVLALALPLAYLGTLWLNLLHLVAGAHERHELPLALHALRDGTLALPLVFAATWIGVVAARWVIGRLGADDAPVAAGFVLAATVALAVSAGFGFANPVHDGLFGHTHAGAAEPPLLLHVLRDTVVGFAANLLVACALTALLARRRPWSAPSPARWLRPVAPPRWAARALVLVVFVLPTGLLLQQSRETAVAEATGVCPAGAPVRHYDVSAIDVDIPLNRFGDHDPQGKMYVLDSQLDAVRAQERSRHVSIGLRDDPIQPLVVRANLGDCVEFGFKNDASGGEYGLHVDGLAFTEESSGDAVGRNRSSSQGPGDRATYRFFVPREPEVEGTHYIRPGPGNRQAVDHGLFGAVVAEPKGSTWTSMDDGRPVESGWEATIKPADGKAFREYVKLFHEVGDEDFDILRADGSKVPTVGVHTDSYRPDSRAINYRSEPFDNRLEAEDRGKSLGYNSYTYGDPATPMPRGYLGDPTKIRILHAGGELFHVYHLHGGGIRWRLNPHADHTYDYADTGLDKHPKAQLSPSTRLDSQSFGPGESYDLEIEGGAGGVQQSAGDFLYHCHIAEHYVSGMWSFWRAFDTRQPDLAPLPDRAPPPSPVNSRELLGRTMPDGTTLTKDNVDDWVRPQLPPAGRPDDWDGSVWNWTVDRSDPNAPLMLGEPEDRKSWPDLTNGADRVAALDGHPGLLAGDRPHGADNRPEILFNPTNGRPAFPLLRPHIGARAPFSPNGHSGAPWLGESAEQTAAPWRGRQDAICPAGAPVRRFDIVSLELPIKVTEAGAVDPQGKIFVLAKDAADVLAGRKPAEPLAIRGNIGDCIAVTLTSEQKDTAESPFSMTNIHIHHVQFDVQASDGVGTGMQFGQAVRPFRLEDPALSAAAGAGDRVLHLASVAKFHPGVGIAVGEGTDGIEIRRVESIDAAAGTVTLDRGLDRAHAAGQVAGTEFVQYRWYPDVNLDNIFWHDHVDGIHNWGHGLVGQFIVEPSGSTYHDPRTGQTVDSGTLVDIHTSTAMAPGAVNGSFRELALWNIDENPATDSTLNLRAAPFSDRLARNGDPSLLFSSWTHGDPNTPLPRAYAGDPFVVRQINVTPNEDTLHIDGHRFWVEGARYQGPDGKPEATPLDTVHGSVSDKVTEVLEGGAGGERHAPGDYLYFNGVGRRMRQGAWGLLRVLPRQVGDLQPLPGTAVPGGAFDQGAQTGGRPPASDATGEPCPDGAPQRTFQVTAVDVPGGADGATAAFVPSADADAVIAGRQPAEPLVLHVAAGECVDVRFTNRRTQARASFHVAELERSAQSSGVNAGFTTEQSVAPGASRSYRLYADTEKIGSATITDFGDNPVTSGKAGLYGALVVAPSHATFADPDSGAPRDVGAQVDVHVPGGADFRDFTAILADDDPQIGANTMPYPTQVDGPALVNYRSVGVRSESPAMFSSRANGDPATPLLRAYAGDPVRVHVMGAPAIEQEHVFGLGGLTWPADPRITNSQELSAAGVGAWETFDAHLVGGAGGRARTVGDFWYGDLRRAFGQAGMWGLARVMSDSSCPIRPLPGLDCLGQPSLIGPEAGGPGPSAPGSNSGPGGGSSGGDSGIAPNAVGPRRPLAPRLPVSRLRVASRLRLAALRRRGLTFRVRVAPRMHVLRTRLLRVRGRGRRARAVRVAGAYLRIPGGGDQRVVWRLDAKARARLRPGTYVLRVQAGRAKSRIATATASARFVVMR
jgi:hypothetical protein